MRTTIWMMPVLCLAALTASCTSLRSGDEKADAGDTDGGGTDGGGVDGGEVDGGQMDAASSDASGMDAGDAGETDAGHDDADVDAGPPCDFPTEGLVGEYMMVGFMEDGGSFYAEDTSGFGRHGDVTVANCTVETMTDRYGLGEHAYKLGYNSCTLSPPNVFGAIRIEPLPVSQQFTIALWLVPDVGNQSAYVAGQADYTLLDVEDSARKLGFSVKESGDDIKFQEPMELAMPSGEVSEGPWTFYAAVVESTGTGTTATLYRNGVVAESDTADRVFDNPGLGTPFFLGNLGDEEENRVYKGGMDDVRIYDRPLSQCEIRQLCHEDGGVEYDAPCPLPGE